MQLKAVLLLALLGGGSGLFWAVHTSKPEVRVQNYITYSEFKDLKRARDAADEATFMKERADSDMRVMIALVCQARNIPVDRCLINPATRAITNVPPEQLKQLQPK